MEFLPFPKLARLNREIVITEKIDGTNAQVYIEQSLGPMEGAVVSLPDTDPDSIYGVTNIFAGSRTRWLTADKQGDNNGFAAWVLANAEELVTLGPGQHFGEWWGGKVQRGYGLTEKRFSLFNTGRWVDPKVLTNEDYMTWTGDQNFAPACCHVVPVLYQGLFSEERIRATLDVLRLEGSVAAPGFAKPEGIVIYHTAANQMFKVTLEGDEYRKGDWKKLKEAV